MTKNHYPACRKSRWYGGAKRDSPASVKTCRSRPHSGIHLRLGGSIHSMTSGDMFFVPGKDKNTLDPHASVVGRKLGRKFITRLLWMVQEQDGTWTNEFQTMDGEAETVTYETEGAVLGVGVWRQE